MAKYPKCQRCGICCTAGPCDAGKALDKKGGICKYLIKQEDGLLACKFILKGKTPKNIGLGEGCILRVKGPLWEAYEDMFGPRVEYYFGEDDNRKSSKRNRRANL